jgi:hypothetical protein
MRLGVFFYRVHRSDIFLLEGAGDERPERTKNSGHRYVQNQPAIDKRALSVRFEGIVNVHVDRRPQLADLDDVVEVNRARRLKPGHGAPPVFSWLRRFAVMILAAQLDGGRARRPWSLRMLRMEAASADNSSCPTAVRKAARAERPPSHCKTCATVTLPFQTPLDGRDNMARKM